MASEVMRDRPASCDAQASQAELENEISQVVVPAIVDRWRAGVADHLAAEPFSSREEAFRFPGDDAVIAYGSTLLLATVWRHWLLLAQIGDGDIVAVQPGGAALRPVPDDPSLDGQQTTSLCEPQAVREFRVAAVDTTQTALLGVLLATDGYGNAQLSSPWAAEFGRELAGLLAQQGVAGVASELPGWAAQCASHDGSGDDTTIALLVSPGAGEAAAAAAGDAAAEDAGAEDAVRTNTVPTAAQPAPMLADTVPADMVPADAVPTDTIPADTVPADVVPADVGAGDAGPADTVPGDTVPGTFWGHRSWGHRSWGHRSWGHRLGGPSRAGSGHGPWGHRSWGHRPGDTVPGTLFLGRLGHVWGLFPRTQTRTRTRTRCRSGGDGPR